MLRMGLLCKSSVIAVILSLNAGMACGLEPKLGNSLGMEFVLIPSGRFLMGSPPDEPYRDKREIQHEVTISKPFYMQTTEVTIKQWQKVMGRPWYYFFRRPKGDQNFPGTRICQYDIEQFLDPQGPDTGDVRVRRGGGWFSEKYSLRSANRAYGHPASRLSTTGFRVVRMHKES
jgi:sulfatase modifying factor 1